MEVCLIDEDREENLEKLTRISKILFERGELVTELQVYTGFKTASRERRLMTPISLSLFKNLKRLQLNCSQFGQAEYIELFSVLAANTKLGRLELTINKLVDDGFFYGNDRTNPSFLQMTRTCLYNICIR